MSRTGKVHSSENRPGARLFRRYVWAGAACAALIMVSVGVPGHFILMRNIVREAERNARELAVGMSDCELSEIMEDSREQGTLVISPDRRQDMADDLTRFLAPFAVTKVKLFDRDGALVYCSDGVEAAQAPPGPDTPLRTALAGKVVSKLEHAKDMHDLTGRALGDRILVETYVPLGDQGKAPLGVFEIYRDVDPMVQDGKRTAGLLVLGLVFAVVVAFLILTLLVREAAQRVDGAARQEDESRSDLIRAKQFLQDVIDALPENLLVLSPQHRILMANRHICQDYDLDPVTEGLCCFELSHGRSAPCEEPDDVCPLSAVLQTGQPTTLTHRHQHGDGRTYFVEVTCSPVFDESGAIIQVIEVSRDVTERRLAELAVAQKNQELVQANARLQEARIRSDGLAAEARLASQAKSQFLANMSHEIRTPLTSILGYADLLAEIPAGEDRHQEYLEVVKRNGLHLLELINDILDLAKIEAGKLALNAGPCAIGPLLQDVDALMRERAQAKGIALSFAVAPEVPGQVTTDQTRLKQALVNLVGNAVKFTDHGSVAVEVACADGPTADGSSAGGPGAAGLPLRFRITDTGIGMDATTQRQVFQAFQQGDPSINRRFGGTGLGLTITQRLAHMLGGDVTATSDPGRGSTFTLTITADRVDPPAEAAPAGASTDPAAAANPGPQPSGNPPDLAGLRILYAEDGRDNQVLVATILRKAGAAQVTIAPDGEAAVKAARERQFDLILMDWQMPVMDGLAATRILRASGYSAPIIALTANAMTKDRQDALDAGCDDFLTKPINRRQLLQAVAGCRQPAAR